MTTSQIDDIDNFEYIKRDFGYIKKEMKILKHENQCNVLNMNSIFKEFNKLNQRLKNIENTNITDQISYENLTDKLDVEKERISNLTDKLDAQQFKYKLTWCIIILLTIIAVSLTICVYILKQNYDKLVMRLDNYEKFFDNYDKLVMRLDNYEKLYDLKITNYVENIKYENMNEVIIIVTLTLLYSIYNHFR